MPKSVDEGGDRLSTGSCTGYPIVNVGKDIVGRIRVERAPPRAVKEHLQPSQLVSKRVCGSVPAATALGVDRKSIIAAVNDDPHLV